MFPALAIAFDLCAEQTMGAYLAHLSSAPAAADPAISAPPPQQAGRALKDDEVETLANVGEAFDRIMVAPIIAKVSAIPNRLTKGISPFLSPQKVDSVR